MTELPARSIHTSRGAVHAGPLLLGLVLLFSACTAPVHFTSPLRLDGIEQPSDSARVSSIFLIGDAGRPQIEPTEPTLVLLKQKLAQAGPNGAVVFLGDNIYPSGLPSAFAPDRPEAERYLMEQLKAVEDFEGRIVFVPGNHDWGNHGLGGNLAAVLRQEEFVENVLDRGNTFLPDNGFPGPVEVPISDEVVLVALDTQWWLEDAKTYGDTGQYQLEQEGSVLIMLDDILKRNAGKNIIVAGHHPLFTNSEHGGYFDADWRPLPLTRRYLGTPQDLSNLKYRLMRNGILKVLRQYDNVVYASGHDHNLQYFPSDGRHFIVSGAGSKSSYVAPGHGAAFVSREKGFGVLHYYTDGSAWLEFWAPEGDGSTGRLLYRAMLREASRPLSAFRPLAKVELGPPQRADSARAEDQAQQTNGSESEPRPDKRPADPPIAAQKEAAQEGEYAFSRAAREAPYAFHSNGTVTVPAADRYRVGPLKRLVLGNHYRDAWATPIEVPVIDLAHTAGGLTPLQKGGGFQTRSLRLQGADGDEYVLRSIDKDPTKSVPDYLRETIAQDVVQDQISAMFPYGAFIVPKLADAIDIYHTYPLLVYVPDDERLGIYREEFAGMLALFESRPADDQSDEARFGFAEDIDSWRTMEENVTEDNDTRVDERLLAKNRLFDMLIGDWDRHKDQWRWAQFEDEHGRIYRPIPRDRDFAFFRFDGPLAWLSRFTGVAAFRRFTDYGPDYGDLLGLNYNGAALDRRYTSSLTREDWIEIARAIQADLTDDVIEEAVRMLPEPVYRLEGEFLTESLKARRDDLTETAADYYELLARIVDVVGSDKHERFEVTRLGDGRVEVVVLKTKKEGDIVRELYRRTFHPDETKEIRLYGLDGDDQFVIQGTARSSIFVRALGGYGNDRFTDAARGRGSRNRTRFHDNVDADEWAVEDEADEARLYRTYRTGFNNYIPNRFEVTSYSPVTFFGWNQDDGLYVGGGVRVIEPGFRKVPFAASHELAVNYATRTQGVNAFYEGEYLGLFGSWDGSLDARLMAIRDFRNFYGFGNETIGSAAVRDSFQARLGRVTVEPAVSKSLLPFTTVLFGPRFEYANLEPPAGWTETDPRSAFEPEDFVDRYFAGARAALHIDGTDTLAATQSGARWLNEAEVNVGLRGMRDVFVSLSSEASYFYTFHLPKTVTLALRAGGATNIGDFEFYQANFLGGDTNLRGFRKNRFAGHTAVYTTAELRMPLFEFNAYLTRGQAGVLAFVDNGRVWADGEDSGVWHQGYGGGIWLTPFYKVALTGTVGLSSEETLFNLRLGFLF